VAQNEDHSEKINDILADWRQGDLVLVPGLAFVYLADLRAPLTKESRERPQENANVEKSPYTPIASDTNGFVIVSQSCDIVRDCITAPMLQLAVVEKMDAERLALARKGSSSKYLFLPAFEAELLVANLDKILTIEKSVLLNIDKSQKRSSVRNDSEAQKLGDAVARKFRRFAFPGDLNDALRKFRQRIVGKTGKDSPEGRTYNSISEIRVTAKNGWNSNNPEPTFLFLFESESLINKEATQCIAKLMDCFQVGGRFAEMPEFRLVTYEDITADVYRRAPPLDLDYLSTVKAAERDTSGQ